MRTPSPLRKLSLAASVSLALLSGCAQPLATAPGKAPALTRPAQPGATPLKPAPAPLAPVIDGLKDPAKTQVATQLSVELSASMRAERTMRDAELLAAAKPAGAYALLDAEEAEEPDDEPEPSATEGEDEQEDDAASQAEGDDHDDEASRAEDGDEEDADEADHDEEDGDHDEEKAEELAKEAWKKLGEAERKLIKAKIEGREAKLLAKLARKLAKKEKLFARSGSDQVVMGADGGKDVTTTFTIENAEGKRTVTVTRKYDADGTVIQTVQKLEGAASGVTYSAERSRTTNPDGTVTIVSDTKMTIGGQVKEVHWEKTVGADGSLSAKGTIKRYQGGTLTETIALSASGTEDGQETISSQVGDGLGVKLVADADSGAATLTVDGGAAGADSVEIDADEEDEDEAEDEQDDAPDGQDDDSEDSDHEEDRDEEDKPAS